MMNKIKLKNRSFIELILLIVFLAYPFVIGGFYLNLGTKILLLSVFALSLDLIWGFGNLFSFGHAIFFGWGAYATALYSFRELFSLFYNGVVITHPIDVQPVEPTLFALFFSFIVPFLIALAIGYFLFYGRRGGIGGVYFAIITLAISFISEQLAISWVPILGGFNGIPNIPPLRITSTIIAAGGRLYYFIALCFLILSYLFIRYLVNSRLGLVLKCVGENEDRVIFLGYNTGKIKLIIFSLAGGIAGLSGGLYVPLEGFVAPPLVGFLFSTSVLLWVAVGGRGTLVGAIIGTIFISMLETLLSGYFLKFWLFMLGGLLLITIMAFPGGIMGYLVKKNSTNNG